MNIFGNNIQFEMASEWIKGTQASDGDRNDL
jgi:hypothetical protein